MRCSNLIVVLCIGVVDFIVVSRGSLFMVVGGFRVLEWNWGYGRWDPGGWRLGRVVVVDWTWVAGSYYCVAY